MEKKVKSIPFFLRFIRFVFPIIEQTVPILAKEWIIKLFFHPIRRPLTKKEASFIKKCSQRKIFLANETIQVYELGEGNHFVFCIHGWGGKAAQFKEIAQKLSENGLKLILFDCPAHGESSGKKTDLAEMSKTLEELTSLFNPTTCSIIGHSMGATAALYSIKNNRLEPQNFISISAPSDAGRVLSVFRKKINASKESEKYIRNYIMDTYNSPIEHYFAGKEPFKTSSKNLIIHDKFDVEASVDNAYDLEKALNADLILTEGNSHNKILGDELVLEKILSFLQTKKE